MSTRACGAIYLNLDKADVKIEENIAFASAEKANALRMGICLGGNVSVRTYELFHKLSAERAILFELVDTPLDNVAEALFAPQGVLVDGKEGDVPESLPVRLKKLQNFLSFLFQNPFVEKVIFLLNYDFGPGYDVEKTLRVGEVATEMLKAYQTEDGFVPAIKLCITA